MKRFQLTRFRRDEDGSMLLEFALVLPLMLLLFAVVAEGGRVFWGYQSAVAGVRDASRYLSRITPLDICDTGGSVAIFDDDLTAIVEESLSGDSVLPATITIQDVTPTLRCVSGGFRNDPVPVATVAADIRLAFPFSGVTRLWGMTLDPVTATIQADARVFGL